MRNTLRDLLRIESVGTLAWLLVIVYLLSSGYLYGKTGPSEGGTKSHEEKRQCIETLSPSRYGGGINSVEVYLKHSVVQDDEFVNYLIAIMFVESSFNPKSISPKAAYGLTQMTQDAVYDAAAHCGLPRIDVTAMLVPSKAVKYGSCYMRKLYQETGGDWTQVLVAYNGGYAQLTRYLKGSKIARETSEYVLKVHSALAVCTSTDIGREI